MKENILLIPMWPRSTTWTGPRCPEDTGRFKHLKQSRQFNQRLLSLHQEEELVRYIIRLIERGLLPTREIILR
jgi:hypothetical protein